MSNRLIKQIIFGSFYLILFLIIGFSIYFIFWFKPTDVDIFKELESISVFSPPQILIVDKDTISVIFQLKNPNFNYGADRFSYSLEFLNLSGEKFYSLTNSSFIYAGRIRTIVEAPIKINIKEISGVTVKISDINWRSVEEFPMLNVKTRAVKIESLNNQIKVYGLVLNNNSFDLSGVDINVSAIGRFGQKIAASKTILKDLSPFEERAFAVFLPISGEEINEENIEIFTEGRR